MTEENVREAVAGSADGRSEVIAREKGFWNARSAGSYEAIRGTIVRAIGEFARYGDRDTLFDPRDKVVLDHGCGQGPDTAGLIRRGARHVTGIDISEAEIDEARATAERDGFADRADFLVADGHATGFGDDSFDLVVGDSILHHLDLRPPWRRFSGSSDPAERRSSPSPSPTIRS